MFKVWIYHKCSFGRGGVFWSEGLVDIQPHSVQTNVVCLQLIPSPTSMHHQLACILTSVQQLGITIKKQRALIKGT